VTDLLRLKLVRAIHTAIYLVMAGSVFAVLYAGIVGAHGQRVFVPLGLVAIEAVVFIGSGMKSRSRRSPRDMAQIPGLILSCQSVSHGTR
jgi:hypothetical protein